MADGDARNTYTVERQALIPAPPARVYAALADFHDWPNWSPWEGLDPDMTRTFSGADAGVGAVYEWKGNRKAGEGRMEITAAEEPSGVTLALDFLKPFKSSSTTRFRLEPEGDGTRVTWTMQGPKTFVTKVMGIFTSMDKLIGKDFEKGLSQLEAHVTA
ncbi:MAG TPA: SRPBCC family protein [Acidimicrobiales bacterium]|nr:SRPBCC family protein [Acidimicrobiales bacterium]